MRVYVPSTLSVLQEAYDTGELAPAEVGAVPAYAVTRGLREWYVSDDVEELEYAALRSAAQASLELLAADPAAVRRRVVVAAEVADGSVVLVPQADGSAAGSGEPTVGAPDEVPGDVSGDVPGQVRVADSVPLAKTVAVHLDAADAERDVATAVDALDAAKAGDEAATAIVDGADDHELLWYATQEIPYLLG